MKKELRLRPRVAATVFTHQGIQTLARAYIGALQHPSHQLVSLVTNVKARVAGEEPGEYPHLPHVLGALCVPVKVCPD